MMISTGALQFRPSSFFVPGAPAYQPVWGGQIGSHTDLDVALAGK
jgi:hypothetical protein